MKIIGSEQYGHYSFLFSQCNLIVALGFGWFNQAQLRYYSTDASKNNYDVSQIIGLTYSTIFCLFIISIFIFFQDLSSKVWLVSIITILAVGYFNYIKTTYQAQLLPSKIVLFTTIQSILSIILPLALLTIISFKAISLLMVIAISFLLASLIMTFVSYWT